MADRASASRESSGVMRNAPSSEASDGAEEQHETSTMPPASGSSRMAPKLALVIGPTATYIPASRSFAAFCTAV